MVATSFQPIKCFYLWSALTNTLLAFFNLPPYHNTLPEAPPLEGQSHPLIKPTFIQIMHAVALINICIWERTSSSAVSQWSASVQDSTPAYPGVNPDSEFSHNTTPNESTRNLLHTQAAIRIQGVCKHPHGTKIELCFQLIPDEQVLLFKGSNPLQSTHWNPSSFFPTLCCMSPPIFPSWIMGRETKALCPEWAVEMCMRETT